jgi:ADP-ribose pyrophosphatase
MDLTERTVESKRIYDGRIVSLRVDTVELPDGKTAHREIVEHRGAVAIVPMLDSQQIVMVRQYRQAAGEVLLEIPAGTLGAGEDPEECARRELIEETGYSAHEMTRLFGSYLSPGYSDEMLHTYLATGLTEGPGLQDEDEFVEVVKINLSDVMRMIQLGEIKDAKSICGCLLAECITRHRG